MLITDTEMLSEYLLDNRFSGTIPDALFQSSSLESIALSANCFTGTLPSSMCEAHNVQVLAMDGLGNNC
jgi:hypothetical protein